MMGRWLGGRRLLLVVSTLSFYLTFALKYINNFNSRLLLLRPRQMVQHDPLRRRLELRYVLPAAHLMSARDDYLD